MEVLRAREKHAVGFAARPDDRLPAGLSWGDLAKDLQGAVARLLLGAALGPVLFFLLGMRPREHGSVEQPLDPAQDQKGWSMKGFFTISCSAWVQPAWCTTPQLPRSLRELGWAPSDR